MLLWRRPEKVPSIFCGTTLDINDEYAGLNIDVKKILSSVASAWAAIRVLNYDVRVASLSQVQFQVSVLYQEVQDGIRELEKKEVTSNMEEVRKNFGGQYTNVVKEGEGWIK